MPGDLGQQRWQHGLRRVVRRSDAQQALQLPLLQGAQRFVIDVQQMTCVGQQSFAVLSEAFVASLLFEQGLTDLFLQALHLLGDGRLRASQLDGGRCEAAEVVDGGERSQEFKVQGVHVLILLKCCIGMTDCSGRCASLK